MKRIGLIDNLGQIDQLRANQFHDCSGQQISDATGGNTGNLAFVFGAQLCINNQMIRVGTHQDPDLIRRSVDQILITCANQIGSHVDLDDWAKVIESFGLPVTLLGLGAQAKLGENEVQVPDGTKKFLSLVNDLRPNSENCNIGVRGKFSQAILAKLGFDSVVVGCPSLFISSNNFLGKDIVRSQSGGGFHKVAVAAGNPWDPSSAFLEPLLIKIVEAMKSAYIIQHPINMLRLSNGDVDQIPVLSLNRFPEIYKDIGEDIRSIETWFRKHSYIFVDVPNWMRFLKKFDGVIGARYHGVALGIQAGIGGCILNIDSRTKELAQESAIKNFDIGQLNGATLQEIVELLNWSASDGDWFDENRNIKAIAVDKFLEGNCFTSSAHLKSIALGVKDSLVLKNIPTQQDKHLRQNTEMQNNPPVIIDSNVHQRNSFLERYNSSGISGWVSAADGETVSLEVFINDKLVSVVVADIERRDIMPDKRAFHMAMPEQAIDAGTIKISVRFNRTLTPKTVILFISNPI